MFEIPLTITISKAYLNLLVIFSNGEWNREVMSTPMILDHCQFNRLKSKIIQRNRKRKILNVLLIFFIYQEILNTPNY